ncbi:DUF1489 family protein [Phreatobacter aquaticus]|uniref:DUF1489 family protein n=1 Tax=Phreatobacter aquaticus TaxID=2570229 RepID=A0A4D7QUT0_9HYPH|nr:DUF1489 family protein [Phreatobacter aquaticus]QCK87722.1 DUF1489 family protein [Phreatobacter aquaticus]
MALNLIKLCVGADSIDDLQQWVDWRIKTYGEQVHTTRMQPKRADELIGEGSLYWVIKGQILCRQRLIGIRPFTDDEGISRCDLLLEPVIVRTEPRRRGPFQGWRYFETKDAPPDLGTGQTKGMPPELATQLAELGLL